MEVTTVSPPPASPTEGDDACVIDVTDVAINSVTLLICLFGLVGNRAVIGLLSLKSGNAGFFDLAVIDFLFLLLAISSAILILVEDVSCSTTVPLMYMNFVFQLSMFSCYWAVYRVMLSRRMRYMRNFLKLCCCCDLPLRLRWVVDAIQYWAFFALFTVIPSVTFLCPSHEQEHCRAALISMYIITLLLFAAPMLVSGTVDLIKAKWGSQQQQPKRRDIVIFVIRLFTLLLSIWNFLQELSYIAVSSQIVFLLACIHSTIKPFIYFLVGRCWRPCSMGSFRLSLQRVFEEQKKTTTRKTDATRDTGV
ncbi:uncharacterized protein RBU47_003515 [Passerculus sandwichensis]